MAGFWTNAVEGTWSIYASDPAPGPVPLAVMLHGGAVMDLVAGKTTYVELPLREGGLETLWFRPEDYAILNGHFYT